MFATDHDASSPVLYTPEGPLVASLKGAGHEPRFLPLWARLGSNGEEPSVRGSSREGQEDKERL